MNQVLNRIAQSLPGPTVISDFAVATYEVTKIRKSCPCHIDNNFSLVITGTTGGVMLKCLADCEIADLWLALHQMEVLNMRVEQDRYTLANCLAMPCAQGVL